jgi:cobalt-precorrin-5B (C1)-methyltransferase
LPDGEKVKKEIHSTGISDNGSVWGCALKFSGDDPDITSGSAIYSSVHLNGTHHINFIGGEGVGRVTLPGLGLEVGGPAINNGPRRMMEQVVREELGDNTGVDITISVPGGKELAQKTFNPRVGVEDGISIIGTSGVVRPFSKDAFLLSISREMDVAKALGVEHLIINSGAKSEQKLKEKVGTGLPQQAFVHYGNFIGETVRMASEHGFRKVTMGIMIGKAVKLAAGNLDTHSKVVTVDKDFVKQIARESGCSLIPDNFTLARELWNIFDSQDAEKFFNITIQPEKEIVMILVNVKIKDAVLKGLYDAIGMETNAQGIAFSLPVDDVIGIPLK